MPTFQRCPTRKAMGATTPPRRQGAEGYLLDAGSASKMPSLVKWAKPTGNVTLVKVGPRKPTMASKLAALVAKFDR